MFSSVTRKIKVTWVRGLLFEPEPRRLRSIYARTIYADDSSCIFLPLLESLLLSFPRVFSSSPGWFASQDRAFLMSLRIGPKPFPYVQVDPFLGVDICRSSCVLFGLLPERFQNPWEKI